LFPSWIDAVRAHGHKFERALWFYDETDVTFPWRGWLMTSQIAIVSSIGRPHWPKDVPYHHDCYLVKTAGKQTDSGGHPTAKPVDVVCNLIAHTAGTIYEPFCGSGSTLIAAEQLGRRRCFAVEITPTYVQMTIDRWEAFTGLKAVKVSEAVRA
jgi:DNA modification methylase